MLIVLTATVGLVSNSLAAEDEGETRLSFSILRGAAASASLEDVCCGKLKDGFVENDSNSFSSGFGQSIVWLRINSIPGPGILDFGPMADDVTLYIRDQATGEFSTSRAGDVLPPQTRELLAPNILFAISKQDMEKSLFVRFYQPKNLSISVRYRIASDFPAELNRELFIHAIFISAIVMMMIFNMLLGILSRQLIFLLNAGFVFFISIINLYFTGVGPAYIWGQWAWVSNYLFELSAIFGTAVGIMFIYYFIQDDAKNSRLVRALLLFPAFAIIVFLGWLVLPAWISQITQIAVANLAMLYALLVIIVLSLRGSRRALWVLPGILFAVGPGVGTVLAFKYFSVEPILPATHLFEITMVIEALFFSLILAYRMRQAEREVLTAYGELDSLQKNHNKNMLRAIDSERRRIASDLHDTAGQGLLAISNRLGRVLSKGKSPVEQREEIAKAADYSRGVVSDIRRISHELHPAILDHLGWREAIEELFSTLSQVNEIEVDLEINMPENVLDVTQKLHLYRIVQEAVSNIAKHSQAKNCYARFKLIDEFASVEIRDNGKQVRRSKKEEHALSLGQLIIDQRIAVLKGTWTNSQQDGDSVLLFKFPINTKPPAKGAAK